MNFTMIFGISNYNRCTIMWCCLHSPMFGHFYTIPACDGHTHTQTQTHNDSIYSVSIVSHSKKYLEMCGKAQRDLSCWCHLTNMTEWSNNVRSGIWCPHCISWRSNLTILTLLMHHSLSIEPKLYWNGAVAYPICRFMSTWVCLSGKCIVAKWLIGSDVLSDRE